MSWGRTGRSMIGFRLADRGGIANRLNGHYRPTIVVRCGVRYPPYLELAGHLREQIVPDDAEPDDAEDAASVGLCSPDLDRLKRALVRNP